MGLHAKEEFHLGIYRHYKGNYYLVLGICRHTETLEEFICYQNLIYSSKWGNNPLWVRPKKMFFDIVEVDGKKVPRYEFIRPAMN